MRRVHTIAHDFNNVLIAILANVELAKTETEAGSIGFERLNRVEEGVIRGRELSRKVCCPLALMGK